VAEEGQGENEVVQPVNPAVNTAANAPANPVANAPATSSTMQPTLPTSRGTPLQTQGTMQELSLLQSRLIVQKEANVIA
jgi:hypothetical protein